MTLRCNYFLDPYHTCGSYAFNLRRSEGIDQGSLCDVHYWKARTLKAEATMEQMRRDEAKLQEELYQAQVDTADIALIAHMQGVEAERDRNNKAGGRGLAHPTKRSPK